MAKEIQGSIGIIQTKSTQKEIIMKLLFQVFLIFLVIWFLGFVEHALGAEPELQTAGQTQAPPCIPFCEPNNH